VVAQYYNFLRLGREGYRRVHTSCYDTGRMLAEALPALGPFELLCDSEPTTAIPAVTWRVRDGEDPGYTLFDLADRLRTYGWQVPAYALTGEASDVVVQRILVRNGVTRDLASILLDHMRDAIATLVRHPQTEPMTAEESSGFNHL
jgi:glutamate decarboxylase